MEGIQYIGQYFLLSGFGAALNLKDYVGVPKLLLGLTEYFIFYNTERMHQSLSYATPNQVCNMASGGDARVIDKFSEIVNAGSNTWNNDALRALMGLCPNPRDIW